MMGFVPGGWIGGNRLDGHEFFFEGKGCFDGQSFFDSADCVFYWVGTVSFAALRDLIEAI